MSLGLDELKVKGRVSNCENEGEKMQDVLLMEDSNIVFLGNLNT